MVIALGALGALEQGGDMDIIIAAAITAAGGIIAAIITKRGGGRGEDAP